MERCCNTCTRTRIAGRAIRIWRKVTALDSRTGDQADVPKRRPDERIGIGIASIGQQAVNIKRYQINVVTSEDMFHGFSDSVIPLEKLHRIQGLPVVQIGDGKGYHPVQTASLLMRLLTSYTITEEPAYLEKLSHITDIFLDTGAEEAGALYFPYTFDFHLHGDQQQLMKAPWYSGMAQGMALSAYVRFYQITHAEECLHISTKIFKSFTHFDHDKDSPWVVYVDGDGYYWIEEYPMWPPANTLNGFIFAIFGLYEYYLLTRDAEAETVLQAAITTIEHYIPSFRRQGRISLYCLKHKVQSAKYHRIRSEQLNKLYYVTGEGFFRDTARGFMRDSLAVLVLFRAGWAETFISFLPRSMTARIYSAYAGFRGVREGGRSSNGEDAG